MRNFESGGGGFLSWISVTTERAPPLSNSLDAICHAPCFVSIYCINFIADVLILNVALSGRYVLVAYIVSMYCISI